MTVTGPEFDIHGASSNWMIAELGAWRWFELSASGTPTKLCVSQGITVYRRVMGVLATTDAAFAPLMANVSQGITNEFRAPLLRWMQRFVAVNTNANSVYSKLSIALQYPFEQWVGHAQAQGTDVQDWLSALAILFTWIVFYQNPPPNPSGRTYAASESDSLFFLPLSGISLPPNPLTFDIQSTESRVEQKLLPPQSFPSSVTLPEYARCFPPDVRLRVPGSDPSQANVPPRPLAGSPGIGTPPNGPNTPDGSHTGDTTGPNNQGAIQNRQILKKSRDNSLIWGILTSTGLLGTAIVTLTKR